MNKSKNSLKTANIDDLNGDIFGEMLPKTVKMMKSTKKLAKRSQKVPKFAYKPQ